MVESMAVEKLAIDGGAPVRSGNPVPLAQVTYGYPEQRAILDVLESGVFCSTFPTATKVKELERAFAAYVGARHAIAFSSGTTAQHSSLMALGIGPGDEVIVPPLTFISTAYTVLLANAVPVFADVDPDTLLLDPAEVARKITPRTKAVVPVHWFGHPVAMDELLALAERHGLAVIEDCAHAFNSWYHGRRVGTLGDMATWSLQQTKVITAFGEGGVVTTDRDDLAARLHSIKDHGKVKHQATGAGERVFLGGYGVGVLGNHYRLTEVQAAFALAQLARLDDLLAARTSRVAYLDRALAGVDGIRRPAVREGVKITDALYPVLFEYGRFTRRIDEISRALTMEGIVTYPMGSDELSHVHPIFTQQIGYGNLGCPYRCPHYTGEAVYGEGVCPKAERLAEELLLLPLTPQLTEKDMDDIAAAVRKVASAYRKEAS